MKIYSNSYNATSNLDLRDMASFGNYGAGSSSFGSSGMTAGVTGAIGGSVLGAMSAINSNSMSKMQFRLDSLKHEFSMKQAGWQNSMIDLQRESVGIQGEQARMAGRSAKVEADLQAALARINARLAESAAQGVLHSGARQEQAKRLETAAFKSRQRAGFAASGVDLTSESAVNVLTSTDLIGDVDANTINANAIRAAWGYRTEGTNSQVAGLMADANGQMLTANANSNAAAIESRQPSYVTSPVGSKPVWMGSSTGSQIGASLLSGATQVASFYYANKGR